MKTEVLLHSELIETISLEELPAIVGGSIGNYTLEYDGFADFPRYPLNDFAFPLHGF